jgi:hypothetical protein
MSEHSSPSRTVFVQAPVHYDASDFTRRLFVQAAEAVSGGTWDVDARYTRTIRLRQMLLLTLSVALIYLGVLVALTNYLPQLTTRQVVGMSLAAAGVLLTFLVAISRRPAIHAPNSPRGRALQSLEWLRNDVTSTRSRGRSFGARAYTLSAGLQSSESSTRARRPASQIDLVSEFRSFLELVSGQGSGGPFMIFVDELDKISSPDDLIDAVNNLKDLFHIPNVHFVVSVSADALSRFELRGLPFRDAFDSSFDTIVRVKALSATESLAVLGSRVEGFPPLLGLMCHSWSGGLPRDLLRTARACVDLNAVAPGLSLPEIAFEVLSEDLVAAIEARIRAVPAARETGELLNVRSQVKTWATIELGSARTDLDLLSPESQAIALAARLAGATLRLVDAHPPKRYYSEPDAVTAAAFECVARAISALGDTSPLRVESFESALSACDVATDALRLADDRQTESLRAQRTAGARRRPAYWTQITGRAPNRRVGPVIR